MTSLKPVPMYKKLTHVKFGHNWLSCHDRFEILFIRVFKEKTKYPEK